MPNLRKIQEEKAKTKSRKQEEKFPKGPKRKVNNKREITLPSQNKQSHKT
jgi:hypothetical protein